MGFEGWIVKRIGPSTNHLVISSFRYRCLNSECGHQPKGPNIICETRGGYLGMRSEENCACAGAGGQRSAGSKRRCTGQWKILVLPNDGVRGKFCLKFSENTGPISHKYCMVHNRAPQELMDQWWRWASPSKIYKKNFSASNQAGSQNDVAIHGVLHMWSWISIWRQIAAKIRGRNHWRQIKEYRI